MPRTLSVATLVATTSIACSRAPEPPPDWTLDEVRQLTDITDKTVSMVRALSEGTEDLSHLEAQVTPLIKAVQSTSDLVDGRGDGRLENQLDSYEYADVSACVMSRTRLTSMLDVNIHSLKEASLAGDEAEMARWRGLLTRFAREDVGCATLLAEFLGGTKSRVAVDRLGAATGAVYATAAASRVVAGLDLTALLQDQIAANERIVARLGQACEKARLPEGNSATSKVPSRCVPHMVALDALPKLRSALSVLSEKGA